MRNHDLADGYGGAVSEHAEGGPLLELQLEVDVDPIRSLLQDFAMGGIRGIEIRNDHLIGQRDIVPVFTTSGKSGSQQTQQKDNAERSSPCNRVAPLRVCWIVP